MEGVKYRDLLVQCGLMIITLGFIQSIGFIKLLQN